MPAANLNNVSMLARDTLQMVLPESSVQEEKTVSLTPVVGASSDKVLNLPQVAESLETEVVKTDLVEPDVVEADLVETDVVEADLVETD